MTFATNQSPERDATDLLHWIYGSSTWEPSPTILKYSTLPFVLKSPSRIAILLAFPAQMKTKFRLSSRPSSEELHVTSNTIKRQRESFLVIIAGFNPKHLWPHISWIMISLLHRALLSGRRMSLLTPSINLMLMMAHLLRSIPNILKWIRLEKWMPREERY